MTELSTATKPSASSINTRTRRFLWLSIRMIFVIVIMAYIVSRIDLKLLLSQLYQVNGWILLLSVLVAFLSLVVATVRWKTLTDLIVLGTQFKALLAFNLIGLFYSQFLPGGISGDVVKGVYLSRAHPNKGAVISSALAERLIGLTSNGIIGLLALMGSSQAVEALHLNRIVLAALIGGALIGSIGLYMLLPMLFRRGKNRFPGAVMRVFSAIEPYFGRPFAILKVSLISAAYFGVWTTSVWLLLIATGIPGASFPMALLILAVVNVAQVIPLSLNGWGMREGALIVLLSTYGIPSEQALLLSLLIVLTSLSLGLLGGLLILIDFQETKRKNAPRLNS